jgi:hypothetical protein
VVEGDIETMSEELWTEGTVFFAYLLPEGLVQLRPLLEERVLRRGKQLICMQFGVEGWRPVKKENGLLLYTVESMPKTL